MFPIFFCFIVFSLWLRYELRKSTKKSENSQKSLLEIESEANFTRKKSIDTLHYITISKKSIPNIKINDNLLEKYKNNIYALECKRIINLSAYTNTELKKMYGPANLPDLTEYDQNFTVLVRSLHNYANRLNELGYSSEAVTTLEYSISLGSDMGSSYKLLADLYNNNSQTDKIIGLLSQIDKVNPIIKSSVTAYLKNYID